MARSDTTTGMAAPRVVARLAAHRVVVGVRQSLGRGRRGRRRGIPADRSTGGRTVVRRLSPVADRAIRHRRRDEEEPMKHGVWVSFAVALCRVRCVHLDGGSTCVSGDVQQSRRPRCTSCDDCPTLPCRGTTRAGGVSLDLLRSDDRLHDPLARVDVALRRGRLRTHRRWDPTTPDIDESVCRRRDLLLPARPDHRLPGL